MSGGLDPCYDFALVGTSLPLSILSAALSRAGFSVLHIDEEEHYGGPWSSLTLNELLEWSRNTALHRSQGARNVSVSFPAFQNEHGTGKEAPDSLNALNRHFSISLAPTIVPCTGPTIDVLIRSKVASYCTFRLLQRTAVFSSSRAASQQWALSRVPSSKEDIFKDKSMSLVDKRRLMKLLQQAVPSQQTDEGSTPVAHKIVEGPFMAYLQSKDGPSLSSELAASVAYGVALCSSGEDSATAAMERIRRHISSIGRYGNAAYLIGQYGGAGEMAQCFCRASAVQGGTFVLGHKLTRCEKEGKTNEDDGTTGSKWAISLDSIEDSTEAHYLIGDSDILQRVLPVSACTEAESIAKISAILLLDRGIPFDDLQQVDSEASQVSPETGLVVFPPKEGDRIGAVTALQMAEGTFSCPKGMNLVYLTASVHGESAEGIDAAEALQASRKEVLKLARKSLPEWKEEGIHVEDQDGSLLPLMECYYGSVEAEPSSLKRDDQSWSVPSSMDHIATTLDRATLQAEQLYWDIVGSEKREVAEHARKKRKPVGYTVGRGLGGVLEEASGEGDGGVCDFFPPDEGGDDDD